MYYIQGGPVEIQTVAHWNLTGRSMTAPPPVSSPSSILPPPLSHHALILARKNQARVSKSVIFHEVLFFLIIRQQLRSSGSACISVRNAIFATLSYTCNGLITDEERRTCRI
jgi:hypothetical protein